jgi:hypothetical protein
MDCFAIRLPPPVVRNNAVTSIVLFEPCSGSASVISSLCLLEIGYGAAETGNILAGRD